MEDKIQTAKQNAIELANVTESVTSDELLNKKGGEIEKLRQRYNLNAISGCEGTKYADDEAHAELEIMMQRGQKLSV